MSMSEMLYILYMYIYTQQENKKTGKQENAECA